MQKVKIVTDSTCDLTLSQLAELGVDFIPAYVIIKGKRYRQHIEITNEELYEKIVLVKNAISTSIPAPGEFFEVFEKAATEAESVICITISSKVSGLYQTASMVAKNLLSDKDITIIDAKGCSLAQGLLVIEAAMMAKEGKAKEEIVQRITHLAEYARAFAMLDTLEYMHRGGRIKFYKKLIGDLLKAKPIIRIDKDGATHDGHIKGRKNGLIHMKMFGLKLQERLKNNRMFVGYTTERSIAEEIAEFLKENGRKDVEILIGQLGAVVGVHGGPGVIGYGFIGEYHPDMFFKLGEVVPAATETKHQFPTKG